jgi:hypothetical protein
MLKDSRKNRATGSYTVNRDVGENKKEKRNEKSESVTESNGDRGMYIILCH